MKLLWVVGNRDHYGDNGELAIGTTKRKSAQLPVWAKTAALLARTAGLNHDIGKASERFQNKLRSAIKHRTASEPLRLGDRIRHEWISLIVFERWRKAMQDWEVLKQTKPRPRLHEMFAQFEEHANPDILTPSPDRLGSPALQPIATATAALDLVTLTHHGLLANDHALKLSPGKSDHVRTSDHFNDQPTDTYQRTFNGAEFPLSLEKQLWSLTKRVTHRGQDYGEDPEYWRAISLIARIAVIAADHEISSDQESNKAVLPAKAKTRLFANTTKGSRALNQPLDWHLESVSKQAGEWVRRIGRLNGFSGLSQLTRDTLAEPTDHPDFLWQNDAVATVAGISDDYAGRLIFNMAGTGAGKTITNLKLAQAATPPGRPCRVSIALNLRSLTLQTAESIQKLGFLEASEIACLIGDSFSLAMSKADNEDEDNDETPPGDLEMAGYGVGEGPEWLDPWAKKQKHPARVRQFLSTPCLVSTVDYLTQAGEPGRQGHHVKAALRVVSSDLILDEVDNYDSKALVAICRVIMMSALFNRNVIVSSATLSEEVASAITQAYLTGQRMRLTLEGKDKMGRTNYPLQVFLADDSVESEVFGVTSIKEFRANFKDRVHRLMAQVLQKPTYRRAFIQSMDSPENQDDDSVMTAFARPVITAVNQLHQAHAWQDPASGKWVSFGVVRVANIKPCVELTRLLGQSGLHVTAYHAEDLKGRRWLKERQFDGMFSRSRDKCQPIRDPEIRRIITDSEKEHIKFVVVATPVEEVGRDHDFDWAVIEPSSAASIVQMAGRVNRHRKIPVDKPNIAILDRNLRSLQKKTDCFRYPGNGERYPPEHQTMTFLLHDAPGWNGDETLSVNSALKFGYNGKRAQLAADDGKACLNQLRGGIPTLVADPKRGFALTWLTKNHYEEYRLRDKDNTQIRCRAVLNDAGDWAFEEYVVTSRNAGDWRPSSRVQIHEGVTHGVWAAPSFNDIVTQYQKFLGDESEHCDQALEVSLRLSESINFDAQFGGH